MSLTLLWAYVSSKSSSVFIVSAYIGLCTCGPFSGKLNSAIIGPLLLLCSIICSCGISNLILVLSFSLSEVLFLRLLVHRLAGNEEVAFEPSEIKFIFWLTYWSAIKDVLSVWFCCFCFERLVLYLEYRVFIFVDSPFVIVFAF